MDEIMSKCRKSVLARSTIINVGGAIKVVNDSLNCEIEIFLTKRLICKILK